MGEKVETMSSAQAPRADRRDAQDMGPQRRRIAFFLSSLAGGGAERSTVRLANGFAARGVAVDVVLAKAGGPLIGELGASCRLIELGAHRTLTSLPRLIWYLRKERPAALISAMNHANLVAIWANRLSRTSTRVIVSIRNTLSKRLREEKVLKDLAVRLIARFIGPAYRHAGAVVAISYGVADDFSAVTGFPRARISVIYNPVVSDELWAKAREPLNHPSFATGGPPIILAGGRLHPQKDFPTLIRAFARVRAIRPGRLMILGEGSERPRLEALIADLRLSADVTLLGFVQNPYPYMGAADLFVLSSRWEGLGNVLIEAMALGTPVVSTDCPSGPREILEGGKWGGLVPVGDVDALATAMIHALDRPGVDLSSRGLDFTVDRAVRQYAEIARMALAELV